MSKHQQWKMLHLLFNYARKIERGKESVLTDEELVNAGVHCEPDTWDALETAQVVIRVGNAYALSAAARKILETFTVAKGPDVGLDIRVDYPHVFVVMPFGEKWSDKVFTEMLRPGVEEAGFTVSRGDAVVRIGDLGANVWRSITQAGVIVVDVSAPNPNVYYEIGLADALGKPIFLFKQQSTTLPSDISGAHYYDYDLSDLPAGRQYLAAELKKWSAERHNRPFGVKELADR